MDLTNLKNTVGAWGSKTLELLVAKQAESFFRKSVADFCRGFSAESARQMAVSGRPFSDVIQSSGFNVKTTAAKDLNPWARHLYNLPDQKLIEMVLESAPDEHVVVMAQYPEVCLGIIQFVKGMVQQQN